MHEGLRLVQRREADDAARLAALRDAVRAGVDDIEGGRFSELGTPASVRSHLATLSAKADTGK